MRLAKCYAGEAVRHAAEIDGAETAEEGLVPRLRGHGNTCHSGTAALVPSARLRSSQITDCLSTIAVADILTAIRQCD
jgi:hypothetical protein